MKFCIQAHSTITKILKPKNRVPKQKPKIKLKATVKWAKHSRSPPGIKFSSTNMFHNLAPLSTLHSLWKCSKENIVVQGVGFPDQIRSDVIGKCVKIIKLMKLFGFVFLFWKSGVNFYFRGSIGDNFIRQNILCINDLLHRENILKICKLPKNTVLPSRLWLLPQSVLA